MSALRIRTQRQIVAPVATVTPGELAWIVALPCAILTLAAVVLLGPPLGHSLLAPSGEALWPPVYTWGNPEPVKHARFALALLGPLLLAACVLVGARRSPRLPPVATRALVTTNQVLLCAGLVAATIAQRHLISTEMPRVWRVFSVPTLVVAVVVAATLVTLLRRPALARRIVQPAAGSRRRAWICSLVAVLATAAWVLPAVATEHTAAADPFPDLPSWAMADAYAVLDGRTPLVDYHAVYGQLWGYLGAGPMALLGDTVGVFTSAMAIGSALALLAVYAVLRRLVRDPLLALALYLPFLATSLFVIAATEVPWRVSNVSIFSVWPMRYAGPWLLAWLTVRQLDGVRPRAAWALALVGGLVAINNLEFGFGALAATFVALACVPERRSLRALARLAASAVAGLAGAALLVTLLTIVRAGSLPRFGLMLEFPHLFGSLGLVSRPMPAVGIHLVIYATFAAALIAAAVRFARGASDVPLTAMLAWSGVFGLGCSSYYAGRSDAIKLAALFPAWAFALTLLLVAVVRAVVARSSRVPSLAELCVLIGFGLSVCSLVQVQAPWRELERLQAGGSKAVFEAPQARQLVAANTKRGDRVAILIPMAHRIAYDAGVVNIAPYGTIEEMATLAQWRAVFAAMRDAGVHKLFLSDERLLPPHLALLERAGFAPQARSAGLSLWTDAPG
jgi:hypothetical protein